MVLRRDWQTTLCDVVKVNLVVPPPLRQQIPVMRLDSRLLGDSLSHPACCGRLKLDFAKIGLLYCNLTGSEARESNKTRTKLFNFLQEPERAGEFSLL